MDGARFGDGAAALASLRMIDIFTLLSRACSAFVLRGPGIASGDLL